MSPIHPAAPFGPPVPRWVRNHDLALSTAQHRAAVRSELGELVDVAREILADQREILGTLREFLGPLPADEVAPAPAPPEHIHDADHFCPGSCLGCEAIRRECPGCQHDAAKAKTAAALGLTGDAYVELVLSVTRP